MVRRLWPLPAAIAVAVAVAAAVTAGQTPAYEATASVVVVPSPELEGDGEVLRSLETLERRTIVATLAKVATVAETRDAAAGRLGLDPRALAHYRLSSSVQPYTNAIAITAAGPDAARAAELANAVVEVARGEARSLYRIFALRPLSRAVAPYRPASPDWRRNLLVAAVLGALAGGAAVWLLESRRRA